jgi:hypothetical protein
VEDLRQTESIKGSIYQFPNSSYIFWQIDGSANVETSDPDEAGLDAARRLTEFIVAQGEAWRRVAIRVLLANIATTK